MKDVRNPDDRLVCRIDETTGEIEILEKGWLTIIYISRDDSVKITHHRKADI